MRGEIATIPEAAVRDRIRAGANLGNPIEPVRCLDLAIRAVLLAFTFSQMVDPAIPYGDLAVREPDQRCILCGLQYLCGRGGMFGVMFWRWIRNHILSKILKRGPNLYRQYGGKKNEGEQHQTRQQQQQQQQQD